LRLIRASALSTALGRLALAELLVEVLARVGQLLQPRLSIRFVRQADCRHCPPLRTLQLGENLSSDAHPRKRGKARLALRVKTQHRAPQPHQRNLTHILRLITGHKEPSRHALRQRTEQRQHLLRRALVPLLRSQH